VTEDVCHAGFYRSASDAGIPHAGFSHGLPDFCTVAMSQFDPELPFTTTPAGVQFGQEPDFRTGLLRQVSLLKHKSNS